jgi:hypothetical protein
MPFLHRAGLDEGMELFDFRVDGVTAISCDPVSGHRNDYFEADPKHTSTNMVSVPKVCRHLCTDTSGS